MVADHKVRQIEKQWRESGSPRCAHESFEPETEMGADTGDVACLECGIIWWSGNPKPAPRP